MTTYSTFDKVTFPLMLINWFAYLHGVSEKTVQNCFGQNFVKFPSIVIIFGR